ncbi:MAG: hypothetical protein ACJAQ3_001647 [Planctomycetota bacterium]|jgi:hypothetical protein
MQPRSLVSALFVAAFTLGACGQAELVQTVRTRSVDSPQVTRARMPDDGLWLDRGQLQGLPTSGPEWTELVKVASASAAKPNLSDQDDPTNTITLAKALVYARTKKARYRDEVIEACTAAMGTEDGGNTLALGRNLAGFVLAADLVDLPDDLDERFKEWLRGAVRKRLDGRTVVSTHEDRPNNWGTHAGGARIAAALYLRDAEDLERAATVFRGWLGDRDAYAGFKYRALDWQAAPKRPVGVNPAGATLGEHSVDGVLPDDQRRGGGFAWPPPKENYVYEALQGALLQAMLLERAGYEPWEWSDRALLRAYEWLHREAHLPAVGDDCWQIHVVNRVYGTDFPTQVTTRAGKNVGFTEWTYTRRKADRKAKPK